MKKVGPKEITIMFLAIITVAVCGYFIWKMMFTKKPTPDPAQTTANQEEAISPTIDQPTYDKINALSDYGQAALTDIGKPDLFAN